MNRGMKITLLAIALFFLFTVGGFIWFVATWDREREEPVVRAIPQSRAVMERIA